MKILPFSLFCLIILVLVACTPAHPNQSIPPITETPSSLSGSTSTPIPPQPVIDLGSLGNGSVRDMAWSPDGKLLAVGSTTGIYLYDARTWDLIKSIPSKSLSDNGISSLSFSPDGKNILFIPTTFKNLLYRFDLQTEKVIPYFNGEDLQLDAVPVYSLDGKSFVFVNSNPTCPRKEEIIGCSGDIELFDTSTNKSRSQLLESFPNKKINFHSIIFSPNGKLVAIGSDENLIRVWNVSDGKLLYQLNHDSAVNDLAFSPDSSVLVSTSDDASVRFWDMLTGKQISSLHEFKQGIQHVAYLQDGKILLLGQEDGSFLEWALNEKFLPNGQLNISMNPGHQLPYITRRYRSKPIMKINPSADRMAISVNLDLQIWDLRTNQLILSFQEFNSDISSMAFSPDNNILAVGDYDLHLWQLNPKKYLKTLHVNDDEIKNIVFRPNSNQLAVTTSEGEVQVWDFLSGQKVRSFRNEVASAYNIDQIVYSSDGHLMAVASEYTIEILDANNGKSIKHSFNESGQPIRLNFSADGNQLFYVGEKGLLGWDLSSDKQLYNVPLSGRYVSASFRSDLLVLGQSIDGPFSFFNPLTGEHLYDFSSGRGGSVVALNPRNGLFARSDYRKILLADSFSGKPYQLIDFDLPYFISFSPDGKFLLANSYDNSAHVWNVDDLAKSADANPRVTATPFTTITPTPSATPISLPITPLTVQHQALLSASPYTITADNVNRITELDSFGLGRAILATWSQDGKSLAIGGTPGIYIFNSGNSNPRLFLPVIGEVLQMAFSPDRRLLAAQIFYSIEVWDITKTVSLFNLEDIGCAPVKIAFSQDGKILTADCGGETYHWSMIDGKLVQKEKSDNYYDDKSPDGSMIIQSGGKSARLLNSKTGQITKTFEFPDMAPGPALFSPDGKTLLIWFYQYEIARSGVYFPGNEFKTIIQLWNILPGKDPTLRTTLSTGKWFRGDQFFDGFKGASFSGDNRILATSSGDGWLQIWDPSNGQLLNTLEGGEKFYFSPDNQKIVNIYKNGIVNIWNVSPGHIPSITWKIDGFSDWPSFFDFSKDGKELISASNQAFHIWSWENGKPSGTPSVIEFSNGSTGIPSASQDGKRIAYISSGNIMLGETNEKGLNWQIINQYQGLLPQNFPSALVFSLDNSLLASVEPDKSIRIQQIGHPEHIDLITDLYPENLVFSPDGNMLLASNGLGSSTTIVDIFNPKTGKLLRKWDVLGSQAIFHPDGTKLLSWDYQSGMIRLWDISSGKLLTTMQGSPDIRKVIISPDGSLLVAFNDTDVEFWNLESGRLLKGIQTWINAIAFSPDGKFLVFSVDDGRIQYLGLPKK